MDALMLKQQFEQIYQKPADCVVQAPGRVNLIGEHIDYCGGSVLPIAIEKKFLIAGYIRNDKQINLQSLQENEMYHGTLPVHDPVTPTWANYPLGVVKEFEKLGYDLPGFDALITSDVPLGSGLSSSAAFEVGTAQLIMQLVNISLDPLTVAQLCQRAENHFVGVNCGLMDQAASACSQKDHALLLDCATPAYELNPMPNAAVVVAHSGVRRGLSASAYNERRSQCEESLRIINEKSGNSYANLCDVPMEMVDLLPTEILKMRSRHVISETMRVSQAVALFKQDKNIEAGQLLNQSHFSLRDDYEVSCPELDELTEICRNFDGVYGSRLTGAGFGGCTITLVQQDQAQTLVEYVTKNYYQPNQLEPIIFVTRAAAGAGLA